jgi:subtilase-type serine protease
VLNKIGSAKLIIASGVNLSSNFQGTINVNAGELNFNTTSSSNTNVNVATSGVLSGTGTIAKDLTANSGGTIKPGNSIGTKLFVTGNYT